MAAPSSYTWKHQLLDLGLMLLSISLWAVAVLMAIYGAAIANFGAGDFWILVGAIVPAAAGWLAWPGDPVKIKKSPWSY